MAKYVDGFLLVVPRKNIAAYRRMAQKAGKIWRQYGALEFFECIGDDLKHGGLTKRFTSAARAKPGEAVFFSFIVFKSKADRDRVNKRVMKDPRILKDMEKPMPMNPRRMTYGGFKVLVDL
jgi:uncharacterized protein YbaA (DUF1428 family)